MAEEIAAPEWVPALRRIVKYAAPRPGHVPLAATFMENVYVASGAVQAS
jgi:hypothetical protein